MNESKLQEIIIHKVSIAVKLIDLDTGKTIPHEEISKIYLQNMNSKIIYSPVVNTSGYYIFLDIPEKLPYTVFVESEYYENISQNVTSSLLDDLKANLDARKKPLNITLTPRK